MSKRLFATAATLVALIASPQARADDWGCQVLLCLSNPAGPMAVAQCVPPIQRLYAAIFKWRPDPFPTCTMNNGQDSSSGGNYAYVAPPSYYDACPSGTTAAAVGMHVAVGRQSTPAERAARGPLAGSFILSSGVVAGMGEGSQFSPSFDFQMPTKVCVGNYLGQSTQVFGTNWDDRYTLTVNVYDRVVLVDPAVDTFNINVMVNNSLFRNIRPFSKSNIRDLGS